MKKIILLLSLITSISISAQKRKATLTFNDGHTETGLAKIEGAYDKIIKFRSKKGSEIFYYNYETVKSIKIEGDEGKVDYEYRSLPKKKNPILIPVIDGYEVGTTTILLNDNSKLVGKIKNITRKRIVLKKANDEIVKIDNADINYINKYEKTKISKNVFKNIKDNNKLLLVEILIEGKISLLKKSVIYNLMMYNTKGVNSMSSTTQNVTTYFITRNNNSYIEKLIDSKGYHRYGYKKFDKKAFEIFQDCPSLISKLKNKEFRIKDVNEVVKFYNNKCKTGQTHTFLIKFHNN